MNKIWKKIDWVVLTVLGSAVFALGFNKYYNRNQFPAPDCYGIYYSPFVLMYNGSNWVVIGASEAASANGGNNAFYSNGS